MQNFFRVALSAFLRLFYKIDSTHMDRLPKSGGVLMISNHVSYIDWLVLSLACPRPIRFILNERFVNMPIAGWFTRLFSSLPVDPRRTRAVIRKTCEAINNGDIVCIFPEGQLSRSGVMNELIKGFTLIASQAKAPIQPVYIDSMWGSIFSFERNRFFKKCPLHLRYPVTINIGELIPYENASPEGAREALVALSAESLGNRPEMKQPLDRALVSALKKRPGAACLIEQGKKKHVLKREQILGLSVALSRYWKTSLTDTSDKIAVFLPPGAAPIYINLGLMIAGKTPVNLPFQHQPDLDQLAAKLDHHGITTLVTSRAFFPQLEALLQSKKPAYHLLDMRSEIDAASGVRVMMERLLARFEPLWSTLRRLELESGSDNPQQAAFAFVPRIPTSSDPDTAKAAYGETLFLSTSNILAQVHQLHSVNFLTTGETVFSESPLNTIEGVIFSLFLPVFSHNTAAMRSFGRQTQGDSIESILRESSASSILLTAKLRQQILAEESWHPQLKEQIRQFLSFQLPPDTSNLTLADHTGTPVLQAYAPTDLGRILAVSMVNPSRGSAASLEQHGNLPNSVGRLLPGIAASHTETWDLQSPILSDQKKCYPLPTGSHIDKEGFVFLKAEDA